MNMSPRIPLFFGRRPFVNGQFGSGGFTLLELVLVLFVLGALAAALAPSVRDIVERSRREAEARSLDELANTINASFENTDLTNLNVAALPGTIAATDSPTVFSASTTNSSSMIGAEPFSRESSRPARQPVTASSRDTRSVKSTLSGLPYFMRSMVRVEPRPRKPMP